MGDLFVISRADIFAIYPQILTSILAAESAKRNFIKDFINLPTDSDYQERVYYRLLAVQKAINDLIDSGALVLQNVCDSHWMRVCVRVMVLQLHCRCFLCGFLFFACTHVRLTVRWTISPKRKRSARFGIRTHNLFWHRYRRRRLHPVFRCAAKSASSMIHWIFSIWAN